jgi:hypothetical protein
MELRLSQHPGVTLVRPDGYVAYAGHGAASDFAAMRGLLERQTNPPSRRAFPASWLSRDWEDPGHLHTSARLGYNRAQPQKNETVIRRRASHSSDVERDSLGEGS